MIAKEWKCGDCGAWIGGGWTRHVHFAETQPTMSEMRAMRMADEAGLTGVVPDAFEKSTVATTYWRTFKEETRDAQNG